MNITFTGWALYEKLLKMIKTGVCGCGEKQIREFLNIDLGEHG